MNTSNYDRLIQQYVARKASNGQTTKIETMLDAIKERTFIGFRIRPRNFYFEK
jgi:hypothetical protein